MGWTPKTWGKLHSGESRRSISIHRDLSPTRGQSNHRHHPNYRNLLSHGLGLCLYAVGSAAFAEGNTTAIANPQAVSSGSVTNQAVQVLQGPYITNGFGGGVQCQGPTLNITPFTTASQSGSGGMYWQPETWTFSPGISGTISIPLDNRAQNECLRAAQAHRARVEAETAKARLDFELVRLLRCGEAARAGVSFAPNSPYASVCSDVVVTPLQVVRPSQPSAPSQASSSPPSAQAPDSQTRKIVEVHNR